MLEMTTPTQANRRLNPIVTIAIRTLAYTPIAEKMLKMMRRGGTRKPRTWFDCRIPTMGLLRMRDKAGRTIPTTICRTRVGVKIGCVLAMACCMLFVFARDAVGYGILAHRYFACKALAGLTQYPNAELEMRQYALCNDCTIFGACRSKTYSKDWISQLHYRLNESETSLLSLTGAVCGGWDAADYTPPGKKILIVNNKTIEIDYPGDDIVIGAAEEDGGYVSDFRTIEITL